MGADKSNAPPDTEPPCDGERMTIDLHKTYHADIVGVSLESSTTGCGCSVTKTEQHGIAHEAGLMTGDFVHSVNGQRVSTAEHAARLIRDAPAGSVHLVVMRPAIMLDLSDGTKGCTCSEG